MKKAHGIGALASPRHRSFRGFSMIGSRVLLAALAGALLTSPAVAETADDGAEFSVPHQRIDIGGRKLNLYCDGEGAPVVVFDSPAGAAGWNWFKVFPAVARHARACIYDRAGLGFSDASRRPSDSANAVEDLHALLRAAAIPGPYLLVGSSYGAMHVQLYAYRYPSEIAGLVLVDGQNEDEFQLLDIVANGVFAKARPATLAHDRDCARSAAVGTVPDSCRWEDGRGAGDRLAAAIEQERASPAYWRAIESEYVSCCGGASTLQLHKARRSFGDFPMTILARSVSPYAIPDQPPSPRNRAAEDGHKATLEAILAYAPKGDMRVVPNAAHLIQIEQPEAVSDTVIEILGKVRAAGEAQRR
jgi:pimeloyl-ACP methyl ester carboxylesterase